MIDDRDLVTGIMPPPPRTELTREQLRWFHNQAIYLARAYSEFFPDVRRPSNCIFDAKPPAGTLAGLMQGVR